jgi:hypothetical protein
MSFLTPDEWQGIKAAFQDVAIKWENYPDEIKRRDPYAGLLYPDRWNHFRKGHKFGVYNAAWAKIEKQYQREIIDKLDELMPPEYKDARPITGWQKLNFCYYYHNVEGLTRAVEQIVKESVDAALEPYQPKHARPGRRRRRREYHRAPVPVDLPALDRPGVDPLLPAARLLHKDHIITIPLLMKYLRIGRDRAARLFELLLKEN